MQCRQAMLKAVGLPVFSSITVLHEDAEEPFIPLSMGFSEFKEPAEAIFIAKPEELHGALFHTFQLAKWIRVKASSPHRRELPPGTRDRDVDTTERSLLTIRTMTTWMTFPGALQVAIEYTTDQACQRAYLIDY